jgi:hypothetical protein
MNLLEASVPGFTDSRSGEANTTTLLALRCGTEAGEGGSCDMEEEKESWRHQTSALLAQHRAWDVTCD